MSDISLYLAANHAVDASFPHRTVTSFVMGESNMEALANVVQKAARKTAQSSVPKN